MSSRSRRRHAARGGGTQAAAIALANGTAHGGVQPRARARRTARVDGLDALRGLAILAMVAYHFAFDLRFFGLSTSDFEHDPFWVGARTAILSSFLLLVGVSLVLAHRAGKPMRAFGKRVAVIAGCALLVSTGSALLFPRTFIYFGVLHCIAIASVLALPLLERPKAAAIAGIAVIVAGLALSHPAFDTRAMSWIGFTTAKPATEDYVPLFPWLGMVLLGVALAHPLAARAFAPIAPLGRAPAWLRWLGRHSLAAYMAHQPLMIGALWLATRALR